MNQTLNTLNS